MDSLQASRIAGGNSAIGRRESDFYPTPPEVTVALLDFLRLPENTVIWEPAVGEGDMLETIRACGYGESFGTDILYGLDFLEAPDTPDIHLGFDWIITNPPFALAEEFIRKAVSLGKPFAFLVKSQFWHAKRRLSLFDEFPPSYILPLTWRPDFFFKDDHGGSPLMDVMWCVWLITGNPHYKAEFKETETALQCAGHTVLNPAELPEGMKPADYMRICFAMLESADVVLFQLGWQVSKGAKLEYDYARYIGKDVITADPLSRVDTYDILRAVASVEKRMRERKELSNG